MIFNLVIQCLRFRFFSLAVIEAVLSFVFVASVALTGAAAVDSFEAVDCCYSGVSAVFLPCCFVLVIFTPGLLCHHC